MSARPMVVWGGTGHAGVVREALDPQQWRISAIFDQRTIPSPFNDVPLFVGVDGFARWLQAQGTVERVAGAIAIGGTDGKSRLQIADFLQSHDILLPAIIHRTAFIATTATLGEGSQVLALAAVCANTKLGRSVIINTASSVDHDCVIGDGTHIAPGARLAGEVTVENCAFIGTGAIVLPRICIGRGAIIGAGAVVTRDVANNVIVVGNPARKIRDIT
ncbi:acetyltransferase [Luteimonas mephitis]|uniref:acetyltransferase n=1 Tax=Luteimonas mephitis TaxID=83615 RepID=UPI003A956213